jgi:transposase
VGRELEGSLQQRSRRVSQALKHWSDSRSGRRKGRPVGFPRFKKKGRARDACRFTTAPIRVESDRHHITLPRLGKLKSHESTRKLARRLEQGTARILAATISRQADRWFVSFTVEVERHIPAGNGHGTAVGVDVGIRYLRFYPLVQDVLGLWMGQSQAYPRRVAARLVVLQLIETLMPPAISPS